MLKNKFLHVLSYLLIIVCSGCCCGNSKGWTSLPPLANTEQTAKVLSKQAKDLNPRVLRLALNAYNNARREGYDYQQVLTVIDYSKPSSQRRFWVFDLRNERLLYDELVAHGRNSGSTMATSFSNQPNSLKSSIGVYTTGQPYGGQHGYSLRLIGLEPGFNDNAYSRAIVVHGAWYVNSDQARRGGVGRSWGCPALNPQVAKPIINTISNGTVIVAYYPDKNWLGSSRFLGERRFG